MPVDLTALKVGSYISYGMTKFGVVSDPAIKIQVLDEHDRASFVDGVVVQLWWTRADGVPHLLREDRIPVTDIREVLGERELPKLVVKERKVVLAPPRPEGYKACDRRGCPKAIFRVVRIQAMRRAVEGFKWGNVEPSDGGVLVALCSDHYKQREDYGLLGETWQDWPKPPAKIS